MADSGTLNAAEADRQLSERAAHAIGYKTYRSSNGTLFVRNYFPKEVQPRDCPWMPLADRGQAFELMQKLDLQVWRNTVTNTWNAAPQIQDRTGPYLGRSNAELRRAIVECAAAILEARLTTPL